MAGAGDDCLGLSPEVLSRNLATAFSKPFTAVSEPLISILLITQPTFYVPQTNGVVLPKRDVPIPTPFDTPLTLGTGDMPVQTNYTERVDECGTAVPLTGLFIHDSVGESLARSA